MGQNAATCSQCFCYICDGPASEVGTAPDVLDICPSLGLWGGFQVVDETVARTHSLTQGDQIKGALSLFFFKRKMYLFNRKNQP